MDSELIKACLEGDIDYLKGLIIRGLDVNTISQGGDSVLYLACKNNHIEIIKFLLSCKEIDVNNGALNGETCLMQVCFYGHLDIAIEMIKKKANVNELLYYEHCLNYALKGNHFHIVKYFIEKKIVTQKSFESYDEYYARWLNEAIVKCPFDIVKFLIDNIKDITVFANYLHGNRTLITLSCQYGRLDVIKYLINLEKVGYSDYTVDDLGCACYNGQLYIVKYFVEEKKMKITDKADDGYTCLLCTARSAFYYNDENKSERLKNNYEIIKYLSENGADLTTTTKKGENCLNLAINAHDEEVILFLINKIKEKHGQTILTKMINKKGISRLTCILGACQRNFSIEFIKMLVENGADVNAKNYNTCLIYACDNNNLELVKYLLENEICKADINATNVNGTSALKRISKSTETHKDIITYLKENGCKTEM